jgi:membrane protease YdiL (CAAX protease family)
MIDSCLNCGKPLSEGESAAGVICAGCASGIQGDASGPGQSLRPGDGWNPSSHEGPIGAIGGWTQPPDADSAGNRPEDRTNPEGNNWGGPQSVADHSGAASFGGGRAPSPYGLGWPSVEQPATEPYDPDRPPWGVGAAIGVWLASVAAIIILPNISVLAWLLYERTQGLVIPAGREEMEKLLAQPRVTLIGILSSLAAHLVTLAIIWAVVTGLGRRSFWKSPEWRWSGPSSIEKALFVVGVVVLMFALDVLLGKLLPESKETLFDRLLKTSANVRVVVAFLAVFTAPLVEEWVYRGVLYAGLRRVAGIWPSVMLVAVLFAGVHFPQYWGAWAGLIGISILSLTLTIIRAKTKSILPCVAVHVVFNAISSVVILSQHY